MHSKGMPPFDAAAQMELTRQAFVWGLQLEQVKEHVCHYAERTLTTALTEQLNQLTSSGWKTFMNLGSLGGICKGPESAFILYMSGEVVALHTTG